MKGHVIVRLAGPGIVGVDHVITGDLVYESTLHQEGRTSVNIAVEDATIVIAAPLNEIQLGHCGKCGTYLGTVRLNEIAP